MTGVIIDSDKAYRRKVSVDPVEFHYEKAGEKPYIKYGCPVCRALENRVSIARGQKNCPLCGVSLNWDRKPEKGDSVLLTASFEAPFLRGTRCTVSGTKLVGKEAGYVLEHEDMQRVCVREAFTLLEEDGGTKTEAEDVIVLVKGGMVQEILSRKEGLSADVIDLDDTDEDSLNEKEGRYAGLKADMRYKAVY